MVDRPPAPSTPGILQWSHRLRFLHIRWHSDTEETTVELTTPLLQSNSNLDTFRMNGINMPRNKDSMYRLLDALVNIQALHLCNMFYEASLRHLISALSEGKLSKLCTLYLDGGSVWQDGGKSLQNLFNGTVFGTVGNILLRLFWVC